MNRRCNIWSCTSTFLSVIVCLTTVLAFTAPEWLLYSTPDISVTEGLWHYCQHTINQEFRYSNCDRWFEVKDNNLPIWFNAIQVIYTGALVFSILLMITTAISHCSRKMRVAAIIFAVPTFLCSATAVCLFGAKTHTDWMVEVHVISDDPYDPYRFIFGWTFWLGVATSVLSMVNVVVVAINYARGDGPNTEGAENLI